MGPQAHSVILYSRPGCHLCDQAREVIAAVRRHHPFAFEEIDIEGEDVLVREYGFRVPVVSVDGREAFEIEVPADDLAALVAG
ncbi:MAG: glutaredoxin family protein [Actinomycetota bacterium]